MTDIGAASPVPCLRMPAGAVMLFLSTCGMAIGLAIDCVATPPELLAALCTTSTGSLAASLAFHATMMPASYAMTTAAAILAAAFAATTPKSGALGLGLARPAITVLLMLAGMFAGGWLAPEVATALGLTPGFATIVIGMAGGMLAASLAASAIARSLATATARQSTAPSPRFAPTDPGRGATHSNAAARAAGTGSLPGRRLLSI